MKTFINIVALIGNLFLIPLVMFKVYGYFSPEVGFDLPALTYWNIFAIDMIISIFSAKYLHGVYTQEVHSYVIAEIKAAGEDTSTAKLNNLKVTFITLFSWLMSYIIYSIIF